jgi:hypothetical protein
MCALGLEDDIYLALGVVAPDNAAIVEKAVRMLKDLGATIATPAEPEENGAAAGSRKGAVGATLMPLGHAFRLTSSSNPRAFIRVIFTEFAPWPIC